MKTVPKNKVIYRFSPTQSPAEYVKPGQSILLETEDALGGQVKDEKTSFKKLDWSKVDGATGPIFIEGANPGDTLVVSIHSIKTESKGIIVVVPKQGALGGTRRFNAATKVVKMEKGYVRFSEKVLVKANPMVGTIGVAPEREEIPTSLPGRHGGNMDAKEVRAGTKLYLPVSVKGALFAAGDIHAVQADGEACVSAVEVAGQILISFNIIKGRTISWPVLETKSHFLFFTCGETLDEATALAEEVAVEALMREHDCSFEEAYMLSSLVVDLEINQVVDRKKGARAAVPKNLLSIQSFCQKMP